MTTPPKKYTKKYTYIPKWLNIHKPTTSMNDPRLHYFTEQVPGYQSVNYHFPNSNRKPITLFFQIDQNPLPKSQTPPDQSPIIDFDYINIKNPKPSKDIVIDKNSLISESQWVQKYEPTNFFTLLTDQAINRDLLTWLKSWDPIVFKNSHHHKLNTPVMFSKNNSIHSVDKTENAFNNPKKMILLAGPPGCGKTTLVRIIANCCKYNIEEINASEDRSANVLIRKIQELTSNETIRKNKRPTLICLDEVDGVVESQGNGLMKVIEFLEKGKKVDGVTQKLDGITQKGDGVTQKLDGNIQKSNGVTQKSNGIAQKFNPNTQKSKKWNNQSCSININRPVIFICNDPYSKCLKQLRSKAHVVHFPTLQTQRIVKRLKQILELQKIDIDTEILYKICIICKNDIRSCIGTLQLVAKQKKISSRTPKDILSHMKISFTRDNESTLKQFMETVFNTRPNQLKHNQPNLIKYIQKKVIEIDNPSLLLQSFFHNILNGKQFLRRNLLSLYHDMIFSDFLMKNGHKYGNQLDSFHMIPYVSCMIKFWPQKKKKIKFPAPFFQNLRKHKANQDTLDTIYQGIPLVVRTFLRKKTLISSYLLSLYLGMQCSSTRQSQLAKSVSLMLSYNFTMKTSPLSLFNPNIDSLLTYGNRQPQHLLTSITKMLMEQNYLFYKQRKQLLGGCFLRDNTEAMLNQMHLQSRKKKNESEPLKFRYIQGDGRKTSYVLTMAYFFE